MKIGNGLMKQLNDIPSNEIFVFGSNLRGIHGAGAALYAKRYYGAVYGVGEGRTGQAYALPTKRTPYQSLTLAEVENHVTNFITYAYENLDLRFIVTPVGCGLAGFRHEEIGPMFTCSPDNCILPKGWWPYSLGQRLEYHDRSE
jgi:hypothetical protein